MRDLYVVFLHRRIKPYKVESSFIRREIVPGEDYHVFFKESVIDYKVRFSMLELELLVAIGSNHSDLKRSFLKTLRCNKHEFSLLDNAIKLRNLNSFFPFDRVLVSEYVYKSCLGITSLIE